MADQPSSVAMSAEELQAFATKLDVWLQGLSPKEQQFLTQILGRAAATDVEGYAAVDHFLKLAPVAGARGAAWHKGEGPFLKIDFLPLLRQIGE